MGSPIDWTHFQTWKQYAENQNGTGYRKNIYICREGNDWYDGAILKQDGLVIDRTCTATNYLEMGNVAAAALTLTIVAPPQDIASWAVDQTLEIQVDIFERSDPSVPEDGGSGTAYMGFFIIDSITERNGAYVIEALDRMVLLDVPMDWSGLVPPDIPSILNKISTVYGVTVATDITTLPNYFQMFADYPNLTVRQVISTIAEVMGCCAFMDWNGELRFSWYAPILNANSSTLELTREIAFSRRTDPQSYDLDDYGIGNPDGTKVELTGPDECKYYLVGNALVESMRSAGLVVSGIADNIRLARYTDVQFQGEYHYYSSGEYEVLPFPYIWPMDVIDVDGVFVPINHVVYRLNANMSLTASADPRVSDYSTAFTSTQQTVLDRMKGETEEINKHFFYTNATGAHITTVENDPDSGNNVLVDSNGLYVREGTDVLAEFTADGAVVGKADEARTVVGKDSVSIYADDTTRAVRIGIKTSVVSADWETASWTGTINAGATKTMALGHTPTSDCLVSAIYSLNGDRVVAQVLLESPDYQAEYGGFTYSISGSTLTYKNNNDENISFSTLMVYGDVAVETGGSFEFGTAADAVGADSVSMGSGNTSSGRASFATGFGTGAIADYAFAEGEETEASGRASHAEGMYCTAHAAASHAEGLQCETTANARAGHAQNAGTIAASFAQTAIGQYNVADSADTYALIIGNGAYNNTRANALTVDWNGDVNMGDILTFGDPSAAIPSIIKHVYGNTNGGAIIIRPGSPLVMGGGEYATNRYDLGDIPLTGTGSEDAYLGADRAVHIESNANTIGNRKTWDFDESGNITTPAGGLINGVDITTRGPKITDPTATTSNKSIASGTTWTEFTNFSLPAGTHIVEVVARFASNASGRRALNLSDSSGGSYYPSLFSQDNRAAVDGNYTFLHINTVIHLAAAKTLYINVAQNSGSSLSTYVSYQYTKIGD